MTAKTQLKTDVKWKWKGIAVSHAYVYYIYTNGSFVYLNIFKFCQNLLLVPGFLLIMIVNTHMKHNRTYLRTYNLRRARWISLIYKNCGTQLNLRSSTLLVHAKYLDRRIFLIKLQFEWKVLLDSLFMNNSEEN